MSHADFDPLELTADSSLNHVVLGDAAGPGLAGLRADQVCSRNALCSLAMDFGLPTVRSDRLSDDLSAAAASTDATTARAAAATLTEFGRRLGALIVTLRDPATAVEQGNTASRRAFLEHWLTVDSVWLSGGLLARDCGRAITVAARAAVAASPRPCRVTLAPHPAIAPLLGAACRVHGTDRAVLADLGHSTIKTGIAEYGTTGLSHLLLLDPRPAPSSGSADEVFKAVVSALVRAVERADPGRCQPVHLLASVASYVAAGAPVDDGQGFYGCLAECVATLQERVGADSGAEVFAEFLHDGTAASAAGSPGSATITVGTWLGMGFRPWDAPPLLPVAPDLRIERA